MLYALLLWLCLKWSRCSRNLKHASLKLATKNVGTTWTLQMNLQSSLRSPWAVGGASEAKTITDMGHAQQIGCRWRKQNIKHTSDWWCSENPMLNITGNNVHLRKWVIKSCELIYVLCAINQLDFNLAGKRDSMWLKPYEQMNQV